MVAPRPVELGAASERPPDVSLAAVGRHADGMRVDVPLALDLAVRATQPLERPDGNLDPHRRHGQELVQIAGQLAIAILHSAAGPSRRLREVASLGHTRLAEHTVADHGGRRSGP